MYIPRGPMSPIEPSPNDSQFLGSFVVDRPVFDDMVWRTNLGSREPIVLDYDSGRQFHPQRSVERTDAPGAALVGAFVTRTEADGHRLDLETTARVEPSSLGFIAGAVRRLRKRPAGVRLDIWSIPDSMDTPQ